MKTTQSMDASSGGEGFLPLHKYAALTSTINTDALPHHYGSHYSTANFDSLSKMLSYSSEQPNWQFNVGANSPDEEENSESRFESLLGLQRWFASLYKNYIDQNCYSGALQEEVRKIEQKNKKKKSQLNSQKSQIESLMNCYRKEQQMLRRRERRSYRSILDEIAETKHRIEEMRYEIQELDRRAYSKPKKRRNSRPSTPAIMVIVGGNPEEHHQYHQRGKSMDKHGRFLGDYSQTKNIQFSSTNPLNMMEKVFSSGQNASAMAGPIRSASTGQMPQASNFAQNMTGDSFQTALAGQLGQIFGQKSNVNAGEKKANVPPPLDLKRNNSSKKSLKCSQNWDDPHEEREVIQILQESEKGSPTRYNLKVPPPIKTQSQKLSHNNKQLPKTMVTESKNMVSSLTYSRNSKQMNSKVVSNQSSEKKQYSIQDRSSNQLMQSCFRIEVPEADDSNDHSGMYSPTCKVTVEEDSNKKTEQAKPPTSQFLVESKSKEPEIRKSSSKDLRNTAGKNENGPQIRQIADDDEDDDDDFFDVNLLAVSKISKEKQFSEKGTFDKSEQSDKFDKVDKDLDIPKVRSSIVRGSKVSKKKMSKIIEDQSGEEKEDKEYQDPRIRRSSGHFKQSVETQPKV